MTAPKTKTKTYKLADAIRQVAEKAHLIVVEAENGETFELNPPELWGDEVFAANGPVEEAIAIMGEDEYARFCKAGGRATLVQHIIQQHVGPVTVGESKAS